MPGQKIWRFFFDADNTQNPEDANRFALAIQNDNDLVIGSRFLPESKIIGFPFYRMVLSSIASRLYRMVLPHPIRDFTSGFRCYRVSALRQMVKANPQFIRRRGFECQVEILAALPAGSRITEISHMLDYLHRVGNSKIKLFTAIYKSMTLFLKLSCKKILSVR